MTASNYFDFVNDLPDEGFARTSIPPGQVQFVLTIPPDFTRRLLRGEPRPSYWRPTLQIRPRLGNAVSAALNCRSRSPARNCWAPLRRCPVGSRPSMCVSITSTTLKVRLSTYSARLIGVILTMTLVLMTGLAITRERERGTMENLLAMPTTPLEVISGKCCRIYLSGSSR